MPPKKKNQDKKDNKKNSTSSPAQKPTTTATPTTTQPKTEDTKIDELKLDDKTTKPPTSPSKPGAVPKPVDPTTDHDTDMVDANEHDKPPKLASQASNPHDTPLPKSTATQHAPEPVHSSDKTEHNKRAAELRAKEKAEKAKNESKQDQEAKKREAEAKAKEEKKKKELAAKLPPHQSLLKALNDSLTQLSRGVETHDQRLLNRVVRLITSIRKQMDVTGLRLLVKLYYPDAQTYIQDIESKVKPKPVEDVKMTDVSETKETKDQDKEKEKDKEKEPTPVIQADEFYLKPPTFELVPEIQVYVLLLITLFYVDQQAKQEAVTTANALFTLLQSHNRRTLDLLSAKVYYYYAYVHELIGQAAQIRNNLLLAHRTACLQHNEPGQASLTTSILRNYLLSNLYAQADTFRLKSTFPENRSQHHHARYLYYLGKINTVQLHYSEAFTNLTQALRKAPQKTAVGFRQHATKLLVCVQLLMGEIPERSLFTTPDLKRSLKPYLQLTQAVRIGDLAAFSRVMTEQKAIFEKDKVYSLIVRLRHNVIKTGLRAINIAYSRISLRDICDKLKLESEEDAEYIVAKAIHDGVIDAVIDRSKKFVFSKENVDVYSTNEPEQAFHKRITFCMQIHNEAVKALRFPPNAHKSQAELLEEEDEDDEGNPRATKKKEDKKEEKKDEKDEKKK